MNTKTCKKCNTKQPLDNFHKATKSADGLHWICKGCRKIIDRNHYITNPNKKKLIRDRATRLRSELATYKQKTGCAFCPETDHVALDFHHINRKTKLFNLANCANRSEKLIWEEVKKCKVVCANCHRKIEAGRQLVVDRVTVG